MTKKTFLIGIIAMVLLINNAFSSTEIFNTALATQNRTWRQQALVQYFDDTESEFKNEPMQFYISYNCFSDLTTLEELEPNHVIENITLTFTHTNKNQLENGTFDFTQNAESITISDLSTPFTNFLNFFTLDNKETELIILDTNYISQSHLSKKSPCNFNVHIGTRGCNRCKQLEFADFQQDVYESGIIKEYNNRMISHISDFSRINFEITLIIFWTALIAFLIFAIGLFVYIILIAVHYIQHLIKGR